MLLYPALLLDESVLKDLTALLAEAKQRIPPFLASFDLLQEEPIEDIGGTNGTCSTYYMYLMSLTFTDDHGCSYCGGLGHRITDCPKLEAIQKKQTVNIGKKDYLASSAADW